MLSVLQLGVIIIHLPFTEVAACFTAFLDELGIERCPLGLCVRIYRRRPENIRTLDRLQTDRVESNILRKLIANSTSYTLLLDCEEQWCSAARP